MHEVYSTNSMHMTSK